MCLFAGIGETEANNTMTTYGYACSTSEADSMQALGIPTKNIFIEKQADMDFDRPVYHSLLKKLEPNDLIYIKSLNALGRNQKEIQQQWRILTKEYAVDIAVLDQPLVDTRQHKELLGAN